MVKSRLAELKRYRRDSEDTEDIEMGPLDDIDLEEKNEQIHPVEDAQLDFMKEFFQQVEFVKRGIERASKAAKRVRDITEERMLAVTEAKGESLTEELSELVDRTNATLKKTKAMLEEMESSASVKPSEERIRSNLVTTLKRKFGETAQEYQRAQQRYTSAVYGSVKRQLEIVKPDITNDEVDDVLKAGGSSAVYKKAILKGGQQDPVRAAYAEVADKYADVQKLEASVQELHQMFLDFSLLVESQGELIDQIEYQVKNANDYVAQGNKDLQVAIVYQREIRKRWCCVCVILIMIIGIILLYFFVISDGIPGQKKKK